MSPPANGPPPLGRFHPLRPILRVQTYAQNNPRGYAVRAGVLLAVPMLLAMVGALVAAAVANGERPSAVLDMWPLLLIVIVPLALIVPILVFAVPRIQERLTRGARIPAGTDPALLRAAHKRLASGEPGPDDETGRLARHLADQTERANSPKWLWLTLGGALLAALGQVPQLFITTNTDGMRLLSAGLILVVLVLVVTAVPLALRRRRRIQRFRQTYDAWHGTPAATAAGDGPA